MSKYIVGGSLTAVNHQLLHVDGGVTSDEKTVYSGAGVPTPLKVSTQSVTIDNLNVNGGQLSNVTIDNSQISNLSLTFQPPSTAGEPLIRGENVSLPDGVDLNEVTDTGFYTLGQNVINGPFDGIVDNGQLIVSANSDSLLQIVSDIYGASWFRVANKIEMPDYLDFKSWQRMGTFSFKGFKDDYTHNYFAGDLDSIDENSIYSFGAQEVFNGPPGLDVDNNERCFVHTMLHTQFYPSDPLTGKQFVYAQGKAFMRHNTNGQWSEWEQLRVVRKPLVTDNTIIQLTSNITNLIYNSDVTQLFVLITLPSDNGLTDGHEVTIMTKSEVSSLSINGNGKQVYGAPSSLPAGGFATFIYSSEANAWFRKG